MLRLLVLGNANQCSNETKRIMFPFRFKQYFLLNKDYFFEKLFLTQVFKRKYCLKRKGNLILFEH